MNERVNNSADIFIREYGPLYDSLVEGLRSVLYDGKGLSPTEEQRAFVEDGCEGTLRSILEVEMWRTRIVEGGPESVIDDLLPKMPRT